MKNTILKSAVVGALALGGSSAFALTAPSTGASDLILLVSNTTTAATYLLDTGISIDSVLPTGSLVSGAVLNTSLPGLTGSSGPSTMLANFLSANPASGDVWTLEAGQYQGTATTGSDQTPGVAKAIFTSPALTTTNSNATTKTLINLNNFENGINQDVIQNTGGLFPLNTSTETTAGSFSASGTKKYGFLTVADSQAPGTTSELFGFTANGSTGKLQSYLLGTASLSTTGTLTFTGNPSSAVPLPAAVWLFGSGLMGLVGVSRRRKAAV
jgi:hypothetical protein